MSVEKIETLIIGGGQAGLAMSEQLTARGLPHLIVERHRIAERWRSERWDGLHANGPAWHDRLPGLPVPDVGPDDFAQRDQMVNYFVAYADHIAAPIRCGVAVTALQRSADGTGFRAETSTGLIEAANVVVATGPFQRPTIPALVPPRDGLMQIHSAAYRNPQQLPDGAVLVIGAGSSGTQIAEELLRAGRRVYLAVGQHERPPRRYRGRDYCWWLGVLGKWDIKTRDPSMEHITIAVSGAYGGDTMDFRRLGNRGITLLGRAESFDASVVTFAPDLAFCIAQGDRYYLDLLDECDAYAAREGLDLPEEPSARLFEPDPASVSDPILALNLSDAGISTIIWATGYALDFDWVKIAAFTEQGKPVHERGISSIPGLYFLGLSWLSRRASAFVFGSEHDATYLAENISARVTSLKIGAQ